MGRVLELTGEVDAYDHHRDMTYPSIGGRDVISAIEEHFGDPRGLDGEWVVTLGHGGDERLYRSYGNTSMDQGWAGTDVTPGDPPVIVLGGFDVLDLLRELDETTVHLRIERIE